MYSFLIVAFSGIDLALLLQAISLDLILFRYLAVLFACAITFSNVVHLRPNSEGFHPIERYYLLPSTMVHKSQEMTILRNLYKNQLSLELRRVYKLPLQILRRMIHMFLIKFAIINKLCKVLTYFFASGVLLNGFFIKLRLYDNSSQKAI
jgi:hypothetical protein